MAEDEETWARWTLDTDTDTGHWTLDTGIVCNPVLISLGFRVNEFNEDSINIRLGLLDELHIEQNTSNRV